MVNPTKRPRGAAVHGIDGGKLNPQEGERKNKCFLFYLFSKRIKGRICSCPYAARAVIQVAGKSMRAAPGCYSGGLVRQDIRGINNLRFQIYLLVYMVTIQHLYCLPCPYRHYNLQKYKKKSTLIYVFQSKYTPCRIFRKVSGVI
jgi:hypothetical protein